MKVVAQDGDLVAVIIHKHQLACCAAAIADNTPYRSQELARNFWQQRGEVNGWTYMPLDKLPDHEWMLGEFFQQVEGVLKQ